MSDHNDRQINFVRSNVIFVRSKFCQYHSLWSKSYSYLAIKVSFSKEKEDTSLSEDHFCPIVIVTKSNDWLADINKEHNQIKEGFNDYTKVICHIFLVKPKSLYFSCNREWLFARWGRSCQLLKEKMREILSFQSYLLIL